MKLRRRLLWVSPEFLTEMLASPNSQTDSFIHVEGMPGDLKIVGATWRNPSIVLTVESETFDEIEEGSQFPDHQVLYRKIDIEAAVLATLG